VPRTAPARALTTGYNAGMAISAALALLTLLLAVTAIRSPKPSPVASQPVPAHNRQ
jgi:hypothetical protein